MTQHNSSSPSLAAAGTIHKKTAFTRASKWHYLRLYIEEDAKHHSSGSVNEDKLTLGPELVQEMTEKVNNIIEKLRIAQTCQMDYYNKKRKATRIPRGRHVFFKFTPLTGVGTSSILRN